MKEHSIVRDLLSLAAAGALAPAEQRRVEEHLDRCEACRIEFDGWIRLMGALKALPTPQAPPKLALQTRLVLQARAAAGKKERGRWLVPALLVLFSWIVTFLDWRLMGLLDIPLARRLDVSSTTVWVICMGVTWLAAALAAGLLVKNVQQEGKII